jgi:hypothetical protein
VRGDQLQHLWEYYQGAYQRVNERLIMLRSQNANLILLTVAVYSLSAAVAMFLLDRDGFRGELALALAAQTLLLGASLALSFDVFRPRDFLDLPISDQELALQSEMTLDDLYRTSIANVREATVQNDFLYVRLVGRHEAAFHTFIAGTFPLLAYMLGRVLGMG